MTKQELNRAARGELERRRQRAETALISRREEIYAAVPELRQLDQKQAEAGATAARLAAEGRGDDAALKLAEVKAIGGRKSLLLRQRGVDEAQLAPQYACAVCGDTGRGLDGRACECLLAEIRRLRREAVNEAGPLRLCQFENFNLDVYPEALPGAPGSPRTIMGHILQGCKDYAADFGPHSGRLFMFGDAGLGKTHLALSIASVVLEKGYDVIYVSAQNAFAQVSAERYSGGSEIFDSMLEADLLVLDDLGTEYIDAYVLSKLYEVVNARMKKPTIYTSNICKREVLEQRYTEKISSRLLGECGLMQFFGRDLRLAR